MKGDFSKDTFDRRNHYSSVRLQQGRVVTDADWNEQADVTRYRSERMTRDVIGPCGAPEAAPAFTLTPGTFALGVAAVADDAWVAGEDGIVIRTQDGGVTWTPLDAATTSHLRAVHFATANVGWVVGDGGVIRRTNNAGTAWVPRDAGVNVDLLGVAASGTTNAWVVGEQGIVARTSDSGVNWARATLGTGRLYAVRFVSATAGWIAGQGGRIYSTIDGGATWTERTSGTSAHLRALAFANATIGWAVGDAGTIRATADGGLTWTAQTSGTSVTLHAVAARSATEAWAAGEDGTILRTTNGGATWQPIDAGQQPDVAFHAAAMGTAPFGWIAGDASTIVRLGGGSPSPAVDVLPAISLTLGAGRFYVKGMLCESDERATYYNQPDRAVIDRLSPGQHLVYLDVWQRHISPLEDPRIREVALGGPDTATRAKTVWQLRTLQLDEVSPPEWTCLSEIPGWQELTAFPAARLRTRAEPEQAAANLCELGEAGGFRRVENQLYRVEVHDGGANPTFKWSRENGSVAFAITDLVESGGQTTVTLANRGADDNLDLVLNGWVEVIDDDAVLENGVGLLRQFVATGNDPLEIVLNGTVGSTGSRPSRHPLIRRWEHRPAGSASALPIVEGQWIPLEDGVEVWFEPGGAYRPGQYWQIPARTVLADVEWPRDDHGAPIARPPAGVYHAYCRLAIIDVGVNRTIDIVSDCRNLFPPLTALTQLLLMSGDGQDGIPGQQLPQPIRARVVRGEHPVEGATVRFEVTDGAGHLAGLGVGVPLDVTTGANGIAECVWFLDPDIRPAARHQRVLASLLNQAGDAVPGQSIEFCATGTLSLQYVSGDGQLAVAGQQVPQPLEVRVANGQTPVPGVPVRFAVVSGGGTLVGAATVSTGANGVASIRWQLGTGGNQRVEAEILTGANRFQHIGFNASFVQTGGGRSCDLTVGPDGDIRALTTNDLRPLLQKFGRLCLCLLPGDHVVEGLNLDVGGFLTIHGCGPGTTIQLSGPASFTAMSYFELAGVTLRPASPAVGLLFTKCQEVVLRNVDARGTANFAGTLLQFRAVPEVTLENCTLGDNPAAPTRTWVAAIVDEPTGVKRFTHNRIQAPVSFYGIPKIGQAFAVERLFGRLAAFPEPLKANGGEVYLEHNSFGLLTLGAEMLDRLNQFATTTQAPPTDIFDAAMLTGNVIRDRESLFLSRLIALTGTSLVVDQSQEPLTTYVGDTASVASTVTGGQLDDSRRMFVVTRKDRCREAANVLFVRHN
jgi:photosystem II stability/assembly factor-like uncharacterized protein